MRADDIRSTTFQTKTRASGEKTTPACVVEEVSHWSQTSAIGLDGRKGENGKIETVTAALEKAKADWLEKHSHTALRADLLRLLMKFEVE